MLLQWLLVVTTTTTIWSAVGARPPHYDTRYPQLSHEERHRLFLMHVINQQFERIFESGAGGYAPVDWDETHNKRLVDMAFHLAQWHLTPECDNRPAQKRHTTRAAILANYNVMFAAYSSDDSTHRLDAIQALYDTIQLGKALS